MNSDTNSNINRVLGKLSRISETVVILSDVMRNKEGKGEEIRGESTPTTDATAGHSPQGTIHTTTPSLQRTFIKIPITEESDVKNTPIIPPTISLNGIKHSHIIPPSSAAAAFYGKHNESPTQFLIRVQEYAESVHTWDRMTLVNGISQFLRDSALERYCQLHLSHPRPQTWTELTN